jgi:hypothetical protein
LTFRDMMADVRSFTERMRAGLEPDHILRRCMVLEEARELSDEIGGDPVRVAHEGLDVLYVVLGAFVEAGLGAEGLERAWDTIHCANMAKRAPAEPGGKATKPEGWEPADVRGALSPEAQAARLPLRPEELVEARLDRVDAGPCKARAAVTLRGRLRGADE